MTEATHWAQSGALGLLSQTMGGVGYHFPSEKK